MARNRSAGMNSGNRRESSHRAALSVLLVPATSDDEVFRAAEAQRARNALAPAAEPRKVRLAPCKFLDLPDVP